MKARTAGKDDLECKEGEVFVTLGEMEFEKIPLKKAMKSRHIIRCAFPDPAPMGCMKHAVILDPGFPFVVKRCLCREHGVGIIH